MKSFLFFCATFKRAVITMTKEGLPCFWHFATINLSQDSFPSSALHSVFNMKNCTAQLVIAVALLRAWQKFGLYSAPISMSFWLFGQSRETGDSERKVFKDNPYLSQDNDAKLITILLVSSKPLWDMLILLVFSSGKHLHILLPQK